MYLRSTVGGDHRWIPGLVVRQTGPVSYVVRERDSDTVHCRHGDQLRAHATAESDTVVTDSQVEQLDGKDCGGLQDIVDSTVQSPELLEPETVALRRSTRVSKPPKSSVGE